MKFKWEIDDATIVEASFGAFGKQIVSVNGREVVKNRSLRGKGHLVFSLPDGRAGTISMTPQFIGRPHADLRIDGRLFIASGKTSIKCKACGASAKPYDQFCDGCGKSLPSAQQLLQERQIREATGAIKTLAWLFSISGLVLFFVARSQTSEVLAKLAGMDDAALIPIGDMTYTVTQLRAQVLWEQWGVLITNAVLAAVMTGLAFWGKRWPLAAMVIATGTYAVVIVINAIGDPKTIAQGIILKIIIIGLFVKGIKAALALRAANA